MLALSFFLLSSGVISTLQERCSLTRMCQAVEVQIPGVRQLGRFPSHLSLPLQLVQAFSRQQLRSPVCKKEVISLLPAREGEGEGER